jgi:hypothetical protein
MTDMKNEQEFELPATLPPEVPVFRGEWDAQGVYVYQAYRKEIAEWALEHQRFGGPSWKPARMTWIKPSFAWMLYRSGYGKKSGQEYVLKIKLSHETIAHLLSHCKCVDTNKDTRMKKQAHEGSGNGRVQWDPERDLFQADGGRRAPRKMLQRRAIQIGLAGSLSEYYANEVISIENVTDLAHRVASAHRVKKQKDAKEAMEALRADLPMERPYLPSLTKSKLRELAMLPGPAADVVAQLGQGDVKIKGKAARS